MKRTRVWLRYLMPHVLTYMHTMWNMKYEEKEEMTRKNDLQDLNVMMGCSSSVEQNELNDTDS